MNWNIFKRLRAVEANASTTETLLRRVYAADHRIEQLVNTITGLNARIETQAGMLGDGVQYRRETANRLTELKGFIDAQAGLLGTTVSEIGRYRIEVADRRTELENRIYFMEQSLKPIVAKAAAEKITKAQAYRRDYYQKCKAARATLAELKKVTK